LILFSLTIGKAQNSIEINAKNKIKKYLPGNHYTAVFVITNTSKKTLNLDCELVVPKEFKLILSKKRATLKSGQKKILLFTFSISKNCETGTFKNELKITSNNTIIETKEILIKVLKLYKLDIEVLKYPDYLRLEKEYYCEYLVTNRGNSTEKVNFESKGAFKITPTSTILKPDSSAVIKVYEKVPNTPFYISTIVNKIRARIVSKDTIFSNRVPITIYPNNIKKPDLFHRFPIAVSTIYNSVKGLDTINAFKFKVEGSGFLDRENKHFLSVNYSGPNQPDLVRFGEYEQYSALYRNNKMEIIAGDVNFSLTNLTESSRYGKGGILTYKIGKSETSIFYLEPRFTNEISDSYGGKFIYNLSPKTYLQFGLINRSLLENNEKFKSQLYSLASFYTNEKLNLRGEVAYESNPKTNGYGMSLEAYLNLNKFYFSNSAQYSDKNFKGYLRNSKQLLSSLNYHFSKKFNVLLSANYSSINPVKDTINYSSSPITSKYQTSFNYRINRNNKIKLGGYIRKKEDRLTPKKYNFEEQLFNLSFHSKKFNRYNFNIYNRFGISKNLLANDITPKKVFFSSFNFSVNILNNFIIGATADYQQTNKQSIDNDIIESFYYGGYLQYYFKSYLDLNVFYKNDYDFDELADEQSYLEAQLNFNLNQKHLLSLSVSQSSLPIEPIQKDLFLTASYTFVVNAPLVRDKTVGSLSGKIISKENEDIEGVLIILDNKIALSNKKGEFRFYNLKPKTYTLNVKRSSLPKGKIILENMPNQIDIAPNKDSYIELNLGKTGNISGQVKFIKSNVIQSSKYIKKLPKLIVKIHYGQKKYYTKIDNEGNFEFKELTPGNWTIELLVKNLIKDFTFDKTKIDILVESDNTSSVYFKTSNKVRQVKKSKKIFKL